MRLLVGVALEEAKGCYVRKSVDGKYVYIHNGGQLIEVPNGLLDKLTEGLLFVGAGDRMREVLTSELGASPDRPLIASSVETPPFEERDEHARSCLCSECDPHGLEVPRDRQPLPTLVIRNKRGPVSPRTIDPDCWLLDEGRWRKVVQRVKGSTMVLVTFDDGETREYPYHGHPVTLATDVTEVAECEGSELPAPPDPAFEPYYQQHPGDYIDHAGDCTCRECDPQGKDARESGAWDVVG